MCKESISIQDYLRESVKTDNNEHVLETFFIKRNFIPKTEEEKHILDSFSFIAAGMSLLINLSMAKGHILPAEKQEIIEQLVFQLHQRSFEYNQYKKEYGKAELEIIHHLYDKLIHEFENNKMHLEKQLELINTVYRNNPQKRFFIIRLCFYIAFADKIINPIEKAEIIKLAVQLEVDEKEVRRIEQEVKTELGL
jgi:uncharacterized tellurite resistance protein B-like protein